MIYATRMDAILAARATLGPKAMDLVQFKVIGDDQAGYDWRYLNPETGEVDDVPPLGAAEIAEKPKAPKSSPAREKAKPAKAPKAKAEKAKAAPVAAKEGMTSAARHQWLEDAAIWCAAALERQGNPVPAGTRVSWGLSPRAARKTLGFCFHSTASYDGKREVFISPTMTDAAEIVGVVLHELTHAALPDGEAHGRNFSKAVRELGLVGKPTATTVGPELRQVIEADFLASHPFVPAPIDLAAGHKKQSTRLIKVSCPHCGYTARTTRKWIEAAGAPICPIHTDEGPMEVEGE